jgi:hypothetical protein
LQGGRLARLHMAIHRDAVNRKLKIFHKGRGKWFHGTIVEFCEQFGKHKIKFKSLKKESECNLKRENPVGRTWSVLVAFRQNPYARRHGRIDHSHRQNIFSRFRAPFATEFSHHGTLATTDENPTTSTVNTLSHLRALPRQPIPAPTIPGDASNHGRTDHFHS